jgi:hypothetical protein
VQDLGKAEFEKWLDAEAPARPGRAEHTTNFTLWDTNKVTATEKRVLATTLMGGAWEALTCPKYQYALWSAFATSGMLVGLSGEHQEHLRIDINRGVIVNGKDTVVDFADEAMMAKAWSRHPNFETTNQVEVPDDDENDSSTSSSDPGSSDSPEVCAFEDLFSEEEKEPLSHAAAASAEDVAELFMSDDEDEEAMATVVAEVTTLADLAAASSDGAEAAKASSGSSKSSSSSSSS